MKVLGLEKTNSLFSLISHQPDIAKICLYAKDPYEAKYQLLINKRTIKKLYLFLVIDSTLASDIPLCLRKDLLERTWKLIMTTDDEITDEKLKYDINPAAF